MTNRHPSGRSVMFFVTLYAYRRILWSVRTGHNEGTKGRTECCKVVSNHACLLDQFSKLSHVVAAMQARGETNLVAAHAAPVRLLCMDNMSYRIGSSPHRISHRWKQMCCEFKRLLYVVPVQTHSTSAFTYVKRRTGLIFVSTHICFM
jgi:hypothetical protein